MIWTKKKPINPGFYWAKMPGGDQPKVVEVCRILEEGKDKLYALVSGWQDSSTLGSFSEWGDEPIDLPSEITKEVAERLHEHGNRDVLYIDIADQFVDVAETEFSGWERDWYDPDTRKHYCSWLQLQIEVLDEDLVPEDTCPQCGGDLADATDIPDDAICDVCGWSRSGVRRCIRCGTENPKKLEDDDAVCRECRAAGKEE